MDNNTRIAKELVKIAKAMMAGFYSTEVNKEVNSFADFKDLVKEVIWNYIGRRQYVCVDDAAENGLAFADDFVFSFQREIDERGDYYNLEVNAYSTSDTECRIEMKYSFYTYTLDDVVLTKHANVDWAGIQDSQECKSVMLRNFCNVLNEAKAQQGRFDDGGQFPEFNEDF